MITEEETKGYLESLKFLDGVSEISEENPIQMKNLTNEVTQRISDAVESNYSIKSIRARNELRALLNTPSSLIDFKEIDFSKYSYLAELADLFTDYDKKKQFSDVIDIFDIVFPLFLRSDFESIFNGEPAIKIIRSIKMKKEMQIYYKAAQVRAYSHQILVNLNLSPKTKFFSILIKNASELILEISEMEKAEIIIPYVTEELALVIEKVMKVAFSREKEAVIESEKLALCTYIPFALLSIASVYPPALECIDWKRIVRFFMSLDVKFENVLPSYDYILKHPESCSFTMFAESIAAIMSSCSLICHSKNEKDKEVSLRIVHVISSISKCGQMATLCSLINISKYPVFRKTYESLKKDKDEFTKEFAQMIVDVHENNYSPLLYQLFKVYDLNNIQESKFPAMKMPLTFVLRFGSPMVNFFYKNVISAESTNIQVVARSIDAVLNMSFIEMKEKLFNTNFIASICNYINDLIKDGKEITDIHTTLPFVHICASLIELCSRLQNNEFFVYTKVLSVDFILKMFRSICIVYYPVAPRYGDSIVSIHADIQLEMERFAKSISNATNFFNVAFLYINEAHPSYAFSTLILLKLALADNMNIYLDEHMCCQLSSGRPRSPAQWVLSFVYSDNKLLHELAVQCAIEFTKIPNFIGNISEAIVEKMSKIKENEKNRISENTAKFLHFVAAILADPKIVNFMISSKITTNSKKMTKAEKIIECVIPLIVNKCTANNQIPVFAVDILMSLCSTQLESNSSTPRNTDLYSMRQLLRNAVKAIETITQNESYNVKIIRMIYFLTFGREITKILLALDKKIRINIDEVKAMKGSNNRAKFMGYLLKTVIALNKYSSEYAKNMIDGKSIETDLPEFGKLGEDVLEIISSPDSPNEPLDHEESDQEKIKDLVFPPAASMSSVVEPIGDQYFYKTRVSPVSTFT